VCVCVYVCVCVCVCVCETETTTYLVSRVVVQHADHRRPFAVRDGVKDLIHLGGMAHVHLTHTHTHTHVKECVMGSHHSLPVDLTKYL